MSVLIQRSDRALMDLSNAAVDSAAQDPPPVPLHLKMLAACTGSLITGVMVTPLDVIRVRLQHQSSVSNTLARAPLTSFKMLMPSDRAHPLHPDFSAAHQAKVLPPHVGQTTCCKDVFWYPSPQDKCAVRPVQCGVTEFNETRYSSTWDGIKKLTRNEGVASLWRGLGLSLFMSLPSTAIYFTGYEYLRDHSPIRESELLNPLFCGALARALASTAVSPLELAKTRLQSASGSGPEVVADVMAGLRHMVRSEGVLSLWRGLVITLWRDVPFSAIYWTSVEAIRKHLHQTPENTFQVSFVAGSTGGILAALATTPFDVGKTRQQIEYHAGGQHQNHPNIIRYMANIYRTEGPASLFVGWAPRVLKVAPACAIMLSSYEVGKAVFQGM